MINGTAAMQAALRYDNATPADHAQILLLNEAAVPAVNLIDAEELEQLHRQARVLLVARAEDLVAGFLLALGTGADYNSLNYQYFNNHYNHFAYVDRIVVNPEFRRMGIGRGLYSALFGQTADVPRITCEVNVVPPNPESLAFHTNLGFEVVAEQDTEGSAKRVALMVRERPGSQESL